MADSLGALLLEQIEILGLRQADVCERVPGLTPQALSNYVHDLRRPRAGVLSEILDALSVHGAQRLRAYELADQPSAAARGAA